MKHSFALAVSLLVSLQGLSHGWLKSTASQQPIQAAPDSKSVNVCGIQQMAQDMIEKKMNERDLFTDIMGNLLSKLEDNSLCMDGKIIDICLKEKEGKPLAFQCTSSRYEELISKFTSQKLCYSKIAFTNTLLSSFINKNDMSNAFTEIMNEYTVASECVDSELKSIYGEVVQLLKDLRLAVVTLSQKMYSDKISEVSKKRENLIAGIFCELRNGLQSKIIQNGLTIDNVGIIKVNDEAFLQEAYYAFSEYYGAFPAFAKQLLEKDGLIDRLVSLHEKLTTYRAKHLVNRLNERSKSDVINNEELIDGLNGYKNYGVGNKNGSFIEADNNPAAADSAAPAETNQATPAATNQATPAETNQAAPATTNQATPAATNQATPAETNQATPAATNQATPTETNQGAATATATATAAPATATTTPAAPLNPLYAINDKQTKDVREYIKELLTDLNIIDFENGMPTGYLNEAGIKKELSTSFISLESNTMLVRFFIKPQAVILSVIQSFIIMTPSPKKDVSVYCKKSIVNGVLTDLVSGGDQSEEEELVNNFASKYNLLYERIKLDELNSMDSLNVKKGASPIGNLSALQMETKQEPGSLEADSKVGAAAPQAAPQTPPQSAPVIAVISDSNGESTESIIADNVNVTNLTPSVENAYRVQSGDMALRITSHLLVTVVILFYFI